jgi:hypothetical protein
VASHLGPAGETDLLVKAMNASRRREGLGSHHCVRVESLAPAPCAMWEAIDDLLAVLLA